MDSPTAAPDNEYMCACMEGNEEKTPHAPSHKVHQCLLITASPSTFSMGIRFHSYPHHRCYLDVVIGRTAPF